MADDPDLKNYDPGRILIIFRGLQIQGFADGSFVKAVRNQKTFKTKVGAAGHVVRIRTRDRTGLVTVTLQATATSNDILQGFLDADELDGSGVGPLMIKDLNGNMLATAEQAWVTKVPDIERSTDGPDTEWEFECAVLVLKNGSSLT